MVILWLSLTGISGLVALVGLAVEVLYYHGAEWERRSIRNCLIGFVTCWAWPVWIIGLLFALFFKAYMIIKDN